MNRIPWTAALRHLHRGVVLAAVALPAAAHVADGAPGSAHLAWSFEPWVVLCLGSSAGLYAAGACRLRRHAEGRRGVRTATIAAFAAGWLALVVALVSPLDALCEFLFAAHMVQHELLMIVAAPLLVLGRPLAVWTWALPLSWRRATGRFFHRPRWRTPWLLATGPAVAWVLHALALWLWHVPALFEAALRNDAVHALQHLSFLLTALVFWWSVLGGTTRKQRGLALLSLFTTMVHSGALGALLLLSRHPWYPSYLATAPAWGLDALQDQQIGGIIMWVPASAIYIVLGLFMLARWISAPPGRPRPSVIR